MLFLEYNVDVMNNDYDDAPSFHLFAVLLQQCRDHFGTSVSEFTINNIARRPTAARLCASELRMSQGSLPVVAKKVCAVIKKWKEPS